MTCIDDHGRCLAYITWLFSLGLVITSIFCQFDSVELMEIPVIPYSVCFFLIANATPLYRVFGVNWFITLVHSLLTVAPFLVMLIRSDDIPSIAVLIMSIPTAVQIIMALFLVLLRPGRTTQERAYRVGIHALMGIITVCAYFLVCSFLIKEDPYFFSCIAEMFYLLLLFMILLTPPCQSPEQAVPRAEQARKKILTNLFDQEGGRMQRIGVKPGEGSSQACTSTKETEKLRRASVKKGAKEEKKAAKEAKKGSKKLPKRRSSEKST